MIFEYVCVWSNLPKHLAYTLIVKLVYLQNACNCLFYFSFLAYDCEYFNKGKS